MREKEAPSITIDWNFAIKELSVAQFQKAAENMAQSGTVCCFYCSQYPKKLNWSTFFRREFEYRLFESHYKFFSSIV